MPKEVLLYDDMYSWTASRAVSELEAVKSSPEIVLRFNGDGGEVRYGFAVIAKAKELKGKKTFKNDGEANSMYAFAFCYNDNNEALDTSVFRMHRASYGMDYESNYMDDKERQELTDKNNKLRQAMEAKMNQEAFQRITGYSFDQFFSLNERVECTLTAGQAMECGLINKIVPLTPGYSAQVKALTAHYSPLRIAAHVEAPQTQATMTIDEIKLKYPQAYKEIYAKGKARGIELELDRVGSILAHIEADQKGVVEAIKSGKPLTATQQSEFALKMFSKTAAATIAGESAPVVAVKAEDGIPAKGAPAGSPAAKTEAEKKAAADFHASMKAQIDAQYNRKKVS